VVAFYVVYAPDGRADAVARSLLGENGDSCAVRVKGVLEVIVIISYPL
jgi:hypothetical protein